MARGQSGQQGHQASKRHVLAVAEERGIVAVRRSVSPISYPVFDAVAQVLRPELLGAARLFDPESLGITLVGFSRYDKQHRAKGPRTQKVSDAVASTAGQVAVRLGALQVFGSGSKHKLGFRLIDANGELEGEVALLEEEFASRGFPLKRDYNATEEGFVPHCSIALLYEDNRRHFQDPDMLTRLGALVTEHVGNLEVVLEPVR